MRKLKSVTVKMFCFVFFAFHSSRNLVYKPSKSTMKVFFKTKDNQLFWKPQPFPFSNRKEIISKRQPPSGQFIQHGKMADEHHILLLLPFVDVIIFISNIHSKEKVPNMKLIHISRVQFYYYQIANRPLTDKKRQTQIIILYQGHQLILNSSLD